MKLKYREDLINLVDNYFKENIRIQFLKVYNSSLSVMDLNTKVEKVFTFLNGKICCIYNEKKTFLNSELEISIELRTKILDLCNGYFFKGKMFNLVFRKNKVSFEEIKKDETVHTVFETFIK